MNILGYTAKFAKPTAKNYWFPIEFHRKEYRRNDAHSLNSFISPVQFARLKQDIQSWRDAVSEAELAWYPHRVKMQRLFQDTMINGQVFAAMERRKNLSLLKDYTITNGTSDHQATIDLLNKEWFHCLLSYCLDARFFGYTLVSLGDLVDNEFPNIQIVKRWNVSPDRHQVVSYVYSLSGIDFLDPSIKDADGNSYFDWSIWVPTSSETGASPCGYGILYKAAYYEILIKNNVGYNATSNELYGMPIRVGTTTKTDEYERAEFARSLQEMGAAGWLLKDPSDDVQLIEATGGGGKGSDRFGNFEERMQKMINKIFFGHADAMDSQTGKLGGEDAAKEAVREIEKSDNQWLENVINSNIFPKLRNLGMPIPVGFNFRFKNDKEAVEARMVEDKNNKVTADIVSTLTNAGYEVDPKYIEERTGIPVTKKEESKEPETGKKNIENRLKALYGE